MLTNVLTRSASRSKRVFAHFWVDRGSERTFINNPRPPLLLSELSGFSQLFLHRFPLIGDSLHRVLAGAGRGKASREKNPDFWTPAPARGRGDRRRSGWRSCFRLQYHSRQSAVDWLSLGWRDRVCSIWITGRVWSARSGMPRRSYGEEPANEASSWIGHAARCTGNLAAAATVLSTLVMTARDASAATATDSRAE